MASANHIRTGLDLLLALVGWVMMTIGLTALLRIGLDFLSSGTVPGFDTDILVAILLQIAVGIICGHYISHKGIKALYIIAVCVPLLLMLLSRFVVTSPVTPF